MKHGDRMFGRSLLVKAGGLMDDETELSQAFWKDGEVDKTVSALALSRALCPCVL